MSKKMTRRDLLNKLEGMLFDLRDNFLQEGNIEFHPNEDGTFDVDWVLRYEDGLSHSPEHPAFTAPAPVPFAAEDDSMSVHFINGDVEYIEPGAEVAETEEMDF